MNFYVLANPMVGDGRAVVDFVPADNVPMGEARRCPVCSKFIGLIPLLAFAKVELDGWGAPWADLVFGPSDQVLVSSRLRNAFVAAGLHGFTSFDPVTVVKVKRRQSSIVGIPPQYWLATIARSRAMLDSDASGLEREAGPVCPECGMGGIIKRLRRIVLVSNTWSGEDVFFARGLPGTILVSERFKILCMSIELSSLSLVDAEMFAFDLCPQERPS